MGDMADFVNDDSDLGPLYDYSGTLTCRCCGQHELHWENFDGKWLLAEEDGRLHICPVNPYKSRDRKVER